jgi:hypothetical protein
MRCCFVDLDGVLVNFCSGAFRVHGARYPDPWPVGVFAVRDVLRLDNQAFWAPMDEQFWADLEPMPDCRDLLHLLEGFFGADHVCILSSPSHDPSALAGKYRWILRHLPAYARRYLIGPAKHFCAGPGKVLLDDHDDNVQRFTEAGGQGVLVPRPWNSGHGVPPERVLAEVARALRAVGG